MKKSFIRNLEYYCFEKENNILERKNSKIKPFDIIKHLVAFANAEGGELAIGIEDDGKITGFKCLGAHQISEYTNICLTELLDTPFNVDYDIKSVKNINNEDDQILVFYVDPSSNRVIKANDNNVYLRQNDKSIKLNFDQILQLKYDKGQNFFEDELIENSSLEDIDENLLNEYKKTMNVQHLSDEEVLKARYFYRDGKLTNAAILLFGNNPTKFLPQARLRVIKYDGNHQKVGTNINIVKEKTFDSAIPNIIKEAKMFIENQLRDFQYLDENGNFKVIPEYPEFAWVEGMVNALTHRNYSIRGEHIKIILYDDRMEFLSPGKLPNIVTVENILNQRFSRNPRIARVLSELGWVKEMNEGVKRIYSEMEKLFLKEPIYSEPNDNVLLVLENNILNRVIRTEDKIKNIFIDKKYDELSSDEKLIVYVMFNSGKTINTKAASEILNKSTSYCSKLLKNLTKQKILSWHGSSNRDKTQYYSLNLK